MNFTSSNNSTYSSYLAVGPSEEKNLVELVAISSKLDMN